MVEPENDRVRRVFARVAPTYDRRIRSFERVLGYGDARPWACGAARGRVLELGCGTGRNLPHYPDDVGAGVRRVGSIPPDTTLEIALGGAA